MPKKSRRDFVNVTLSSYDSTAVQYAQNVELLHPESQAQKFQEMLPKGAKILDVGCGSGRDAKVFSEKGFDVTGVDFSSNMIELATVTAPKVAFQVNPYHCGDRHTFSPYEVLLHQLYMRAIQHRIQLHPSCSPEYR